jgi:SAM-dependent methyltransferase
MKKNLHAKTVASFSAEWSQFDQMALAEDEARAIFDDYFSMFPWDRLPAFPVGFDMGCGTGRWARLVAPRVSHLHCIDPSGALFIAQKTLASFSNVSFHQTTVEDAPLTRGSQDFGYSLGVLHHVPDTAGAIRACTALLKPGAPFLVYLYYAFDKRPLAFRLIWRCSDLLRKVVHQLPERMKLIVTDVIAALVYFPLARTAALAERLRLPIANLPLSYYRSRSFYTMRTDARDRFGTPLEQRFTREQITSMLEAAELTDIRFSERAPYWCAVGIRR